jgi:hypothetical protein
VKDVSKNNNLRKKYKELTKTYESVNDNEKGNNNGNKHNLHLIANNSATLKNPCISDRQNFIYWYNTLYTKLEYKKTKPTTKNETTSSNYFQCLDTESEKQ